MIVNLNVLCKVQLNEAGKRIWNAYVDAIPQEIIAQQPQIIDNLRNKVDSEDCVEMELWAIMAVFGPYMSPEMMPFARPTIDLNKNPIFTKQVE